MQGNDLITIGILNMNGLPKLRQVIDSVFAQDYEPKEIIVSDNGSTDGSIEYLRECSAVKLIENGRNLGYGAGKNIIVENASGRYVLMLDNDILLTENRTLSSLLEFYRHKDSIAFLSLPLVNQGQVDTDHYGLFYTSRKKNVSLDKLRQKLHYVTGGFIGGLVFFEKSIFEQLGRYETIYPINLDDYDLSVRAWLAGQQNYVFTKHYAVHLGVGSGLNPDSICFRTKFYFCGFSRMAWKNYKLSNLLLWWPMSGCWICFKALRSAVKYRSIRPILAFLKSVALFIRDFGDTLKQRKSIQSKRIVKDDIFLKIKPPKLK